MKILYLKKRNPNETLKAILDEQQKEHELFFIDLNQANDFDRLIRLIEESDQVISW